VRSYDSQLDSWSALSNLIERLARQDEDWIFRGEPSTTHELRPAAGREGHEDGARRRTRHDVADERASLQRFKHDARPYLADGGYSDLEWLAIAEHHGMATRLLDWTESLLVAAFFAVEHAGHAGHALIYGISGLPILDPNVAMDPFAIRRVAVYRPPHITSRIAAQRSVFTLHPRPTAPFRHRNLRTWTVTREACAELKRILDSCAVNYASLFPDLGGLAAHIGWRYKWGMSQGNIK
jgi:hypothetical protein